jgi:hypothetical protein
VEQFADVVWTGGVELSFVHKKVTQLEGRYLMMDDDDDDDDDESVHP